MVHSPMSSATWTAGPTLLLVNWTQSKSSHVFASASSANQMGAHSAVGVLCYPRTDLVQACYSKLRLILKIPLRYQIPKELTANLLVHNPSTSRSRTPKYKIGGAPGVGSLWRTNHLLFAKIINSAFEPNLWPWGAYIALASLRLYDLR